LDLGKYEFQYIKIVSQDEELIKANANLTRLIVPSFIHNLGYLFGLKSQITYFE
jgi:hypothetical protein